MENAVIKAIEDKKIIAIVRGVHSEKLIPLAKAMYDGGIRLLEVTYSADKSVSDSETANSIALLKKHFGKEMHIGAGTVLTMAQLELTKQAGGEFIISPDTVPELIKATKELQMISIPGAMTPSEISLAHKSGADFVKIFPIVSLGPEYVKAIRAPLPNIKLLAVGGIDVSNMVSYLRAGVCGFGIGGNIVDKRLLENNDFNGLTTLAKKYVSVVEEC